MRIPLQLLLAFLLLASTGCHGLSDGDQTRRHVASHVLSSGRLRVEVMDPSAPDRYNRGNRFSPVANVLRATLDGTDFLYSPVTHDPLADNAGLAMEFDLKEWPDGGPPGFAEAKEGESFLKVGVGVLKKAGAEYAFYKPYDTVAVAPTTVEWHRDHARFRQVCPPASGYAYTLEAEVRVHDHALEIEYRLSNAGEKPFSTEQYAHNFFSLGGQPSGPGYEVELPCPFTMHLLGVKVLQAHDQILTFARDISAKKASSAEITLAPSAPGNADETIIVRHPASGLAIRAHVSRPTAHITIHAATGYVCPEQFVRLRLQPGESAAWVRSYDFLTKTTDDAR